MRIPIWEVSEFLRVCLCTASEVETCLSSYAVVAFSLGRWDLWIRSCEEKLAITAPPEIRRCESSLHQTLVGKAPKKSGALSPLVSAEMLVAQIHPKCCLSPSWIHKFSRIPQHFGKAGGEFGKFCKSKVVIQKPRILKLTYQIRNFKCKRRTTYMFSGISSN